MIDNPERGIFYCVCSAGTVVRSRIGNGVRTGVRSAPRRSAARGALPHLITVTEPCGRWCSGSRRTIAGWRSRALGRRIVGRRRPPTPPHPQPLNQGRSKIREELACYAPQNSGLRCLHVTHTICHG